MIACFHNGTKHQIAAMEQFSKGLRRHGLTASIYPSGQSVECDLAVIWGVHQHGVIARQKGKHFLVMERGYIGDRFQWTSLGFDGLNGRAKFPKIDDDGKRWREHFQEYLRPWRFRKMPRLAVVMGQVIGDASLHGINFIAWVKEWKEALEDYGYCAMFRRHPLARTRDTYGLSAIDGSLDHTLDLADLVVTCTSNAGVDSVLAGTPTIATDSFSMVYDLMPHKIEKNFYPPRVEWQRKMAYTQWLPHEIENGDAWEALKTVKYG